MGSIGTGISFSKPVEEEEKKITETEAQSAAFQAEQQAKAKGREERIALARRKPGRRATLLTGVGATQGFPFQFRT